MSVPKLLREQIRQYEREGFTVENISRAARHYKVKFHQFPEPQFLTANTTDFRAYKNNVARFKRLTVSQEKGFKP